MPSLKINLNLIKEFIHHESSSAVLLLIFGIAGLILANSPYEVWYSQMVALPWTIKIANSTWHASTQSIIDNGLMALFFLLVGLEIKRELIEGELRTWKMRILPGIAAAGGMLVPAIIYLLFNMYHPIGKDGWAIPCATDIAFALGILTLLGSRVPLSLKIFLTALAILDDLGAIIIIAGYYTHHLQIIYLALAILITVVLVIINWMEVRQVSIYLVLGFLLWLTTLLSGLHATIAGVVLACTIPLQLSKGRRSPLRQLEDALLPWVAYVILPAFAFANTGVSLQGFSIDSILQPVTLGIILGLAIGKPLGIFGASMLAIKSNFAIMPSQSNEKQLLGVAILCGVGFTMSLFINILAFSHHSASTLSAGRLGILLGSTIAGVIGYSVLRLSSSGKL